MDVGDVDESRAAPCRALSPLGVVVTIGRDVLAKHAPALKGRTSSPDVRAEREPTCDTSFGIEPVHRVDEGSDRGPVAECDRDAAAQDVGSSLSHPCDSALKPCPVGDRVGIGERDDVRCRRADADVACSRETNPYFGANRASDAVCLNDAARPIARAVIDNDQLKLRPRQRLVRQRFQESRELVRAVPCGDDNRDERSGRSRHHLTRFVASLCQDRQLGALCIRTLT